MQHARGVSVPLFSFFRDHPVEVTHDIADAFLLIVMVLEDSRYSQTLPLTLCPNPHNKEVTTAPDCTDPYRQKQCVYGSRPGVR